MASLALDNLLITAVKNKDLQAVQNALAAGADANARTGSMGRHVLHYAVGDGNIPIIRALIMEGADVNKTDERGFPPLHEAIRNGDMEAVRLLLAAGSSVNQRAGDLEVAPLHAAVYQALRDERADIVVFLIEQGADENIRDSSGRTMFELLEESRHKWPYAREIRDHLAEALRARGRNHAREKSIRKGEELARAFRQGTDRPVKILRPLRVRKPGNGG